MTFTHLLAKSRSSESATQASETLPGHTLDVMRTALTLGASIGNPALRSMGLEKKFDLDILRSALLRSAALHDLGKANTDFQTAVRRGNSLQALRHEYISAWLVLQDSKLSDWLFSGSIPLVRYAAIYAVLGHHLKLRDAAEVQARPSGSTSIELFLSHSDFRDCLAASGKILGLPPAPDTPSLDLDICSRPLAELRSWLGRDT